MAHIFKHPTKTEKGIVVFTHKEMNWFFPHKRKRLLKSLFGENKGKKIVELIGSFVFSNKIKQSFHEIKKDYFVGVHYGWDISRSGLFQDCDFIMAQKSNLPESNNFFKIPLSARSFTPSFFKKQEIEKKWDIICISRSTNFKNLDIFLKSIRKIFDKGFKYKILLINPASKSANRFTSYKNLMIDYMNMFSEKERQDFTIMQLKEGMALSQQSMPFFYNASKVFGLFSKLEGDNRTTAEALMCGLTLVVFRNLKGGAADYLDEENSVFFDSFEDIDEALIEAVENYQKLNKYSENLREFLSEEYSIKKLSVYFEQLYNRNGQEFDGSLINTDRLSLRLPAHLSTVEWNEKHHITTDISSRKQLQKFLVCLQFKTFQK